MIDMTFGNVDSQLKRFSALWDCDARRARVGDFDLAGRERGRRGRGDRTRPSAERVDRPVSFAEMMFLMLRGDLPTPAQARVLDALHA
jgi:hypothetical protein